MLAKIWTPFWSVVILASIVALPFSITVSLEILMPGDIDRRGHPAVVRAHAAGPAVPAAEVHPLPEVNRGGAG